MTLFFLMACLFTDAEGRFDREYVKAARDLKREYTDVRGTVSVRSVKGDKRGRPRIYHFATGPDRRKFEYDVDYRTKAGKRIASTYGFAELEDRNIEAQKDGPSQPFTVRAIGDKDPIRRAAFNAMFGKYLKAPWAINGPDMEAAVAKGMLTVIEAHEVEYEGRNVVEVTFQTKSQTKQIHYRVTFDPAFHWAILRASEWTTDPEKPPDRYEVTYGPTASGKPYMKTVRWWDGNGQETLCEFDAVEFAATPAAEFTLEHYGLKSPPLPAKGPNYRLAGWIAAAAVGLLGVAWLLRRFATRTA